MFQHLHSGGCRQRSVEREQPVDSSQVKSFQIFTILFKMLQRIIISKIQNSLLISGAGSQSRGKPPTIQTTIEVNKKNTLGSAWFICWRHFLITLFEQKTILIISISFPIFSKRIVLSSYFLCAHFVEDVSNEVEQ